jgi:hypothetical protein
MKTETTQNKVDMLLSAERLKVKLKLAEIREEQIA